MIVIVFGLRGSGKSYFAQQLAQMLHAEYIGSDVVRKELFKTPSYSTEEKNLVYNEMMKRMMSEAFEKEIVIDTTFSNSKTRQNFTEKAKKFSSVFTIEIAKEKDLTKQRSLSPQQDNANFEVYKKIKPSHQTYNDEHLVLRSTQNNLTDMLDETSDYLFQRDD